MVYDAYAGFITGGGWIAGASGNTNDKTHFNIDVRYSASAPTGQFRIHGSSALLDLTSTVFEYLVVKGSTASFRGTGVLSDGTPVGFFVSAQDGKAAGTRIDRIRLKVWKSADGQVLFDTEPGISEIAPPANHRERRQRDAAQVDSTRGHAGPATRWLAPHYPITMSATTPVRVAFVIGRSA